MTRDEWGCSWQQMNGLYNFSLFFSAEICYTVGMAQRDSESA